MLSGVTTHPVLIATDLREASDVALVRGHAHAVAVGAPVVVCHVVPDFLRNHPLFPQRNESDILRAAELIKEAAELVSEQVGRVLRISPDAYTVEVATGSPEDEVVRVAEEHHASPIVLGGKPRTGLQRVLGHVAERVVRYAHAPVLVARPGKHTNKILVATDFSKGSTHAMEIAGSLMKTGSIEGVLLHVMQRPSTAISDVVGPFGSPWMPPAKGAMDELGRLGETTLEGLAKQYGFARWEQLEGDPAATIAARAESLDAEMVIMGSRGRTGLVRLVLGSTAEKVIRESVRSVLVTR
jgi:nucleotide-binding universal stress UspA family protein